MCYGGSKVDRYRPALIDNSKVTGVGGKVTTAQKKQPIETSGLSRIRDLKLKHGVAGAQIVVKGKLCAGTGRDQRAPVSRGLWKAGDAGLGRTSMPDWIRMRL